MLHGGKTAEERFHMLARGWLAYPVTLVACATTAEERLQRDAAGRYDGFSRMVAIPLTQLSRNRRYKISCKNIFLDLCNRSSAVDSSSATDPRAIAFAI